VKGLYVVTVFVVILIDGIKETRERRLQPMCRHSPSSKYTQFKVNTC